MPPDGDTTGTAPAASRWHRLVDAGVRTPALAVAVAAAWGGAISGGAAAFGARARDLTGDELHMLHLPPGPLLAAALDPSPPFWAHQPLSFVLRSLTLSVLGEDDPLNWRLHAIASAALLGAIVAGVPAAATGARGWAAGMMAGLLCALHPVLRFYGQDAGNYALSAVVCAGLLLGARQCAAGGSARLLGISVGLALMTDLYTIPWAIAATLTALTGRRAPSPPSGAAAVMVASPWLGVARGAGPLALGWLVGGLSLVPPALRLLADADGQLALHADPPPPHSLPLPAEVSLRLGLRAAAAMVGGLADGRGRAAADALPLVALAAGAWAWIATAGGHTGRIMWKVSAMVLGAHVVLGIALQALGGRVLPVEPRAHIGLAVALLVGAGAALRRTGPAAAIALGLPMALVTAAATLTPGDLRSSQRDALRALAARAPTGVVVAEPDAARWVVSGLSLRGVQACLTDAPHVDSALWVFDHEPADVAPPRCDGPAAWPDGWGIQALTSRPPPAHERSSSSFQPTRNVARIGPLHAAPAALAGWRIALAPRGLPRALTADTRLVVETEHGDALHPFSSDGGQIPRHGLAPDARLRLVLRAEDSGQVLAQSDVLVAGVGGDWALWLDPLDLPRGQALLRGARLCGALALAGVAAAAVRRLRAAAGSAAA